MCHGLKRILWLLSLIRGWQDGFLTNIKDHGNGGKPFKLLTYYGMLQSVRCFGVPANQFADSLAKQGVDRNQSFLAWL